MSAAGAASANGSTKTRARTKKTTNTRNPSAAQKVALPATGSSRGGRKNILREAATLFATQGYAESGLREIAGMAGVRSSTVYHHFASKEKIYEAIIRIALEAITAEVTAELLALPANATPRMRVEASVAGHLRALHANKPFTSTNAHSRINLPKNVNQVIGPLREQYSDYWRSMLVQTKAAGWLKPGLEPKILRPLILSTLNRTLGWYDPKKGSMERLIATVNTMFSGIWLARVNARPPMPGRLPGRTLDGGCGAGPLRAGRVGGKVHVNE